MAKITWDPLIRYNIREEVLATLSQAGIGTISLPALLSREEEGLIRAWNLLVDCRCVLDQVFIEFKKTTREASLVGLAPADYAWNFAHQVRTTTRDRTIPNWADPRGLDPFLVDEARSIHDLANFALLNWDDLVPFPGIGQGHASHRCEGWDDDPLGV